MPATPRANNPLRALAALSAAALPIAAAGCGADPEAQLEQEAREAGQQLQDDAQQQVESAAGEAGEQVESVQEQVEGIGEQVEDAGKQLQGEQDSGE
jgi:peptidoglycan hydrolase CwlO-like protein